MERESDIRRYRGIHRVRKIKRIHRESETEIQRERIIESGVTRI